MNRKRWHGHSEIATLGPGDFWNRGTSVSTCKERAAATAHPFNDRSGSGHKDRFVPDRGDRWFFQVRDCRAALQLCGHHTNH